MSILSIALFAAVGALVLYIAINLVIWIIKLWAIGVFIVFMIIFAVFFRMAMGPAFIWALFIAGTCFLAWIMWPSEKEVNK